MFEEFQHGEVREIRFVHQPANAMHQPFVVQLTNRLRAASLEGARAVVLSGTPGMFSGGLDVPFLITLDWNDLQRFMRSVLALQNQLAIQAIPVLAAITGHCAASAAMMAAFCDYRVMARGPYKMGLNEVSVGLCPGRIAYQSMRRLIGARHADRLIVTGEFVGPEEAFSIGMVDALAEPDQVIPHAIERANMYVKLPQQALYETRRIARADLVSICEEAMRDDSEQLHKRWFSEEAQRGLLILAARLSKIS